VVVPFSSIKSIIPGGGRIDVLFLAPPERASPTEDSQLPEFEEKGRKRTLSRRGGKVVSLRSGVPLLGRR